MLSIDYYHKLKDLFPQDVHKSSFIYFYTVENVVQQVGFRYRKKNHYKLVSDVPHEKLLLSRDKKLPRNVIVQVKTGPLAFDLFEG